MDSIIIGGGMTYTFLKAMGYEIGNSICELDRIDIAKETIEKAEKKGVKLLFPIDTVCGKEFSNEAETIVVDSKEIPKGWQGLDIGPKAIEEFTQVLKNAKTAQENSAKGSLDEAAKIAVGNILTKELAWPYKGNETASTTPTLATVQQAITDEIKSVNSGIKFGENPWGAANGTKYVLTATVNNKAQSITIDLATGAITDAE